MIRDARGRYGDIQEIKALPDVPLSRPFVERLIDTIRRELLDQLLFRNASDLERKLASFRRYYNSHRTHTALGGSAPAEISGRSNIRLADLSRFQWKSHYRGLYQPPARTRAIFCTLVQ